LRVAASMMQNGQLQKALSNNVGEEQKLWAF
jgi:hypothetical protein